MTDLVTHTLDIARSQLGVRERGGENRGVRVERYLASVGLGPGAPWCAAFVYWCAGEAASALSLANPLPRTGYCPSIDAWAVQHGLREDAPQPGDLFLRYVQHARHTGFVTAVSPPGFDTVEGNTNIDGSAEGIGVFARRRGLPGPYKFVRWGGAVSSEQGTVSSGEDAGALTGEGYELYIQANPICRMPVVSGHALCPIRKWCEYLGFETIWDPNSQSVYVDGRELDAQISLIDQIAYAPVRSLVQDAGLRTDRITADGVYVER